MMSKVTAPLPVVTALDLVRPARLDRLVTRSLAVGLVVSVLVLVLTPWQQTAPGTGKVVAYAADERRQNIEAPIEGRIVKWYVREGAKVESGDPIVDLSDNDPDIMVRLRAERDATAARVEAALAREKSIEAGIASIDGARTSTLSAAGARVRMASQRTNAARQAVDLASATLETAALNLTRQRSLADQGLASTRNLELARLEAARAQTEVERARAALEGAKHEEGAIAADRGKFDNDAFASLNAARASQASARADVLSAAAELARIEVRLARQSTQAVTAPRAGFVLRIVKNGQSGEIVKSGDVLAVLVPETKERAVEVWLSGNDMPLVREGTAVRIQFEGWPALQFSGWPSIALGTFGGRVAVLDASDDGMGKFRILVVPEHNSHWPEPRYLRQGVRIQAWVLLGQVRLGYELWRQFNGFPPALPTSPDRAKAPAASK